MDQPPHSLHVGGDRPRPLPRVHPSRTRREKERRYSSSDGEDGATGYPSPDHLHGVNHTRSLGLTRDENHISPIENLDHTINRLYSYLSGSEGDIETDHPLTPPKQRPDNWENSGSRSPSSSVSSRCSSRSPSISDHEREVTNDTIDSGETGENVYSHINEAATLPLPPIPPPPLEEALGPAVPPRGTRPRTNSARVPPHHLLAGDQSSRTGNYTEVESDFEPHYLVQTASGNIFIPPVAHSSPPASPGPPLPFPRTVPRNSSLPSQRSTANTPTVLNNGQPSRSTTLTDTPGTGSGDMGTPVPHNNSNTERPATNYSVGANPNVPPLPTYPSVQNDFRDYSRFMSASYRVKKHFKGRCTWKCTALVFMLLTVVLAACVAYFAAMKVYDLNWTLKRHPFDADGNGTDSQKASVDVGGSTTSSIGATLPSTPTVVIIQYPLGKRLEQEVPPRSFWRSQFYVPDSRLIKFNFTIPSYAVVAVYGRRNVQPTHAQYDFFQLLDGNKIVSRSRRSLFKRDTGDPVRGSTFVEYLESGVWYVFVYNDGDKPEKVAFVGTNHDQEVNSCPNSCRGRGDCVSGQCHCFTGYKGWDCSQPVCPVLCKNNGIYVRGVCKCYKGWKGKECDIPSDACMVPDCHGNGQCVKGTCVCAPGFTGPTCSEEICLLKCAHGTCKNQRCSCDPGWNGALCDHVLCDPRCAQHGFCKNGTCVCKPGWNGRHCSLDGCPDGCSNNGVCQFFQDGWQCSCRDGWKGPACDTAMEMLCDDSMDADLDGLIDCQDPDCCMSISCKNSMHCLTSPNPMEILLRRQPPSTTASFYERMKFLVEDDSVQSYATLSSFNASQVSVIRGKVLGKDGSQLIGVRVSVVTQPLYGFTLSRELGLFDILVNGGGSVTLQFQRKPFRIKQVTVMVPWNRIVTMDVVTLTLGREETKVWDPICSNIHDHMMMKPVVLSTWQHTQLGACPTKSTIIPESQVLQESLQVPGTDVYLVYHSSETPGYMSTIMIQLTPDNITNTLTMVHLRVSVEGLVFEKTFEADPGIKYKFAWDRRNAYNQKVYGIVTARVGVGYQYTNCSHVFWAMQSATMSGYDITSSEIGGWNLHIHHTYNFQEGILHKGDGTNIYLKERPRKVITVLGNGKRRKPDCRFCDGKSKDSRLMAPVALASGRDGSLYVGDFNFIRKLGANREDITRILQLNMPGVPYKYFMTVSPTDGRLYISDHQTKQVIRVKTMGTVRDLTKNYEAIAGNKEQCVPGEKDQCGDGGMALEARLLYPKGIAINKDGIIYFADGANVRMIDRDGRINTLIGHQGQPTYWKPLPCGKIVNISEITLHWPTALAVDPLDDTLHILDNNMVLKVTKDKKIIVVAGRPLHCPPRNPYINSLLEGDQAGPRMAAEVHLESPQHISFGPNGDLYIVETDHKTINRIRVVTTDGTIRHYAGAKARCDCAKPTCKCFDPKVSLATRFLLNSPTAITVTPDNVLHIADMGNLRVHSVVATLPERDRIAQYEVLYPQAQELYIFNRFGQHVSTKNIITDQFLYNFTYNVNSYYGKLVKVTDSSGNHLSIQRDYTAQATQITAPDGQKCKFLMDNMGQLHRFVAGDNTTTSFTYFSSTGLLETKQTSEGHTFIYEYDDNGRLESVVQPTGEKTQLTTGVDPSGALAHLSTDSTDTVAMATNGNMLSILHAGNVKTKVSYMHDGSLVVEYPSQMAITVETNPHPLLSTEHQLHMKRKVILADNLVHRLEWRYYLRREGKSKRSKIVDKVGRRMRVGRPRFRHGRHGQHGNGDAQALHALHDSPQAGEGAEGKALMVNGDNLLTLEYDRETHSEVIYNKQLKEILTAHYNSAGQPTFLLPRNNLMPVNITYDARGRLVRWVRGDLSIVNVYDSRTGHLTEKKVGNRANYRYIYKAGAKPTDVILPSGKQYLLRYDHYSNLAEVVMPDLGRHRFHTLTTIGFHRKIYKQPGTRGLFIQDFDSSGKLLQVAYPSGTRRMTYYYNQQQQHTTTVFDWSDITYKYYQHSGVLHSMNLTNRAAFNFTCAMLYDHGTALVKRHHVRYNGTNMDTTMANAIYQYHYDQNFRIVSLVTEIGKDYQKSVNFTYNADTGRLMKIGEFIFQYPQYSKRVIKDSNVEIVFEYDNYGRSTDSRYKFANFVVFTLEINYDSLNRVNQWRRKIGATDMKAYEYQYDIDHNIVGVILDGKAAWTYAIDANSNIVKITHGGKVKKLGVNIQNQVVHFGDHIYRYNLDGFLVQRDEESFEYNSQGQLIRAFEPGKCNIYYFYDARGRLVARKDLLGGYLTQYFYADIQHVDRVTHVYDQATQRTTYFLYDDTDKLFAMEIGTNKYYIALDPMGSPLAIFNSAGSIVKHMAYDPLGKLVSDSSPNFKFVFGFQGGLLDPVTQLVIFGKRVYDPNIGRWTAPDYDGLYELINRITHKPEVVNLYQHHYLVNTHLEKPEYMNDITSWLYALGYNLNSLVPNIAFSGQIRPDNKDQVAQRLLPITSAFQCAFERDMRNFVSMSTVPRSKVTPAEEVKVIRSFQPYSSIFGDGILLSIVDGKVSVNVLDNANEVTTLLAKVLLNNTEVVRLHFTIHGRDCHYFVKQSLQKATEDIRDLSLKSGEILNGINVTIHRYNRGSSDSNKIIDVIDIRLHGNHTVLNIRYGTTVSKERDRILRHAKERAVTHAWELERELVQRHQHSINSWNTQQQEELLQKGMVADMEGHYIRDIHTYPELADDPKNIKFQPAGR